MGATAGVVAAAAAARELERTLDAFRVADATASDRGQTLEALGLTESATVSRLVKAGVILPGRAGRVYLSEAAYVAYRSTGNKRRVAALLAAGILILMAGLGALVYLTQAVRPAR